MTLNGTSNTGSETPGTPESAEVADRRIPTPYPGLRSFRQDEAALFFGREIQARQLRDILAERNLVVVLGGSGSGKSSLVRAGLLPKLNSTAPIPKRSGAWYVVEFRPRTHPAAELFEAIYQQIFQRLLAAPSRQVTGAAESNREHSPVTASTRTAAARRDRRYEAISTALKIEPPLQPGKDAETRCEEHLRKALFSNNEFDVGALFEFADETIVTLDEKLAAAPRSGRANLLLLIDQFEEVFSLPADREKAGLNLVMSLVTSIQTYQPFNLFLIVTMRNEWLHRCSEFPGVAEAMNGSTYLVDLLAGPEVEKVIVQPARSVLRAAGLDAATPRAGPYAAETLSRLRDAFGDESSVAHASDRLPLLQHLLPLVWDQAMHDWAKGSGARPLSVEVRHLEAVPGWRSAHPLSACLNANAECVLARAVAVARKSASILGEDDARRLLQVAFCRLAVLDDKGIVRRRFATIDQMLSAAGIVERNPAKREELKKALSDALAEFKSATLIDCHTSPKGDVFDINHEALVRNWKTYADWVKRARDTQDRLIELDRKAQPSAQQSAAGQQVRWAERVQDLFLAANLRSAADDVGSETSKELIQDVFGPSATFSRSWVQGVLDQEHTAEHDVEKRRELISQRVYSAERFRNNIWDRYRPLAVISGILAVFIGIVAFFDWWNQSQKRLLLENMHEVLTLQRLAQRTGDANSPQGPQDQVETYAAFKIALSKVDDPTFDPFLQIAVAETLMEAERKLRSQLSRAVWLRTGAMSQSGKEHSVKDKEHYVKDAVCIAPTKKAILPAREGIVWGQKKDDDRWYPTWQDSKEEAKIGVSLPPEGEDWPAGSVVCTSPDGNWQFIWLAKEGPAEPTAQGPAEPTAQSQPGIRNIEWNRLPKSSGNTKVFIKIGDPRTFTDAQSINSYHPGEPDLFNEFAYISRMILGANEQKNNVIKFVKDGHWIGFSITLRAGKTVTLWTVAGLSEPEEVDAPKESRECASPEVGKGGCYLDQISIGEKQYRVFVEWRPPKGSPPDYLCESPGHICPISVGFQFTDEALRTKIERPWSTVIKKGISKDGYLWLQDDAGQVWRYLIDPSQLLRLHEDSWRGLDRQKLNWSGPCKKLRCWDQLPPEGK